MIRPLNGKTPAISPSAYVDEMACLIGDVIIGENTFIFPGAVIRADMGRITIGSQTVIEDNCVIHSGTAGTEMQDVTIGDRVILGHGAALNCRSVGNCTLIGMNATVLHDAEIGDYCIVAAASVVTQGKQVPDYSLVLGVPGKIKGRPTDEQLWWVKEGYKAYEALAEQYRSETV